ncbi:Gcd10p family-domain-containing protein [Durotheca rogersii]|uniref:Gcd10p family-domain-containing protein n=1 Tax=Durotheca rogersii TaxID=419775 RepID=UPI0022208151|nr:Gcd10p family-domain-containing protein [Durotheca rogersii]KAI5862446.1 Gcd10p family-domain-containing protein [Durotheca rogersii]
MHSLVQPHAWVVLKLPSGNLRVLQVTPNTTISLGKYGSFPSNLIIHRPYHLTYELEDRKPGESFNRLRIVPASELYSDILSSDTSSTSAEGVETPATNDGEDADNVPSTGIEYSLVDPESGAVVARTNRAELDASARQALSMEEIEALKKDGTDAGKDLIAKLMLSHTAINQKTQYSLAKYKLLKTKKYIRRVCVLPLDVPMLNHWQVEEKDANKVMDMREEMTALLGCWANVHFGGEDRPESEGAPDPEGHEQKEVEPAPGRWLIVDDTGGLLVAAMAERMGILYPPEKPLPEDPKEPAPMPAHRKDSAAPAEATTATGNPLSVAGDAAGDIDMDAPAAEAQEDAAKPKPALPGKKPRPSDLQVPYARTNTITVVHANSQPNLSFLRHFDFDVTNASQTPEHPLASHLMTLSWLQLVDPAADSTYAADPPTATPELLRAWKPNRRGTYHRKRRRWARVRHVADAARAGGFAGLVVATAMDPVSVLRHTVPLLAGGAPIAVYSPSVEPLAALADCYSTARRAAWAAGAAAARKDAEDDEDDDDGDGDDEAWPGSDAFPLNPALVLGASVQTSRARRWQVLPGRTHPLMTSRGGAEGYVFTGWRVRPAEGKVEARGNGRARKKKKAAAAEAKAEEAG